MEYKGKRLTFPLISLIDVFGHRLVAMSFIKGVNALSTLVYGSRNAGKDFEHKDKDISELLKLVGRKMGLSSLKMYGVEVTGPIDLEVHLVNNKYYVLDSARTVCILFICLF